MLVLEDAHLLTEERPASAWHIAQVVRYQEELYGSLEIRVLDEDLYLSMCRDRVPRKGRGRWRHVDLLVTNIAQNRIVLIT